MSIACSQARVRRRVQTKTIGIIGGVGWTSTLEYYRRINQGMAARLGGNHAAEIAIYSFDYGRISRLMQEDRWDEVVEELARVARALERAGAGVIVMSCNTMHYAAAEVRRRMSVPLLHIAEEAAREAKASGWSKVALLGSAFVTEQPFYQKPFEDFGIEVMLPPEADRREMNRIVFDELGRGDLIESSKRETVRMIEDLGSAGADGVVLACTELPLLVHPEDTGVRMLDTMAVHTAAAVSFALS